MQSNTIQLEREWKAGIRWVRLITRRGKKWWWSASCFSVKLIGFVLQTTTKFLFTGRTGQTGQPAARKIYDILLLLRVCLWGKKNVVCCLLFVGCCLPPKYNLKDEIQISNFNPLVVVWYRMRYLAQCIFEENNVLKLIEIAINYSEYLLYNCMPSPTMHIRGEVESLLGYAVAAQQTAGEFSYISHVPHGVPFMLFTIRSKNVVCQMISSCMQYFEKYSIVLLNMSPYTPNRQSLLTW